MGQKVYWLDGTNGNDSNNGLSENSAYKTFQYFTTYVSWADGDTLYIKPSEDGSGNLTYYDFGNSEAKINSGNDLVIIGTGGRDRTIFDAESKNRHFTKNGNGDLTIKGITFQNGKVVDSMSGSIDLMGIGKVTFVDVTWKNNLAEESSFGGAISIFTTEKVTFTNCIFDNNGILNSNSNNNNWRNGNGGAVYFDDQGQTNFTTVTHEFNNCLFKNNFVISPESSFGGAISSRRQVSIDNSVFAGNYTRASDVNSDNYSEAAGGAIFMEIRHYNSFNGTGIGRISNSTFDNNWINITSPYGNIAGGTISTGRYDNSNIYSRVYIFNTIITRNGYRQNGEEKSSFDNGQDISIVGAANPDGFKTIIDYSIIQGSEGKNIRGIGDYVFDIEPAFSDTVNFDYSLKDISPAIGAGIYNWTDEGLTATSTDYLGNTRPNPNGTNPDLGAFENSLGQPTAPLPITKLVANRTGDGRITLSWKGPKEKLGSNNDAQNIGYVIYNGNDKSGESNTTSFSISGLTNGQSYTLSVASKDTQTNSESVRSSISIVPRYTGKWYIASSGGTAANDTVNNYNWGSQNSPANHLTSALSVAETGDTIVYMEGNHTGSNNRGTVFNDSRSFVIMGDPNVSADKVVIDAGYRDRHFSFNGDNIDTTFKVMNLTLAKGRVVGQGSGGGSVYIGYGFPKFYNVIFDTNVDSTNNWIGGGAIEIHSSGSAIIDSSIFRYNRRSSSEDSPAHAGAIGIHSGGSNRKTIIRNTKFIGNKATTYTNNMESGGSAIYTQGLVDIYNSVFTLNQLVSNAGYPNQTNSANGTILYNSPSWYGNNQSNGSPLYFVNNTVVNNYASGEQNSSTSGIYYCDHQGNNKQNDFFYAFNNIIYNNKLGTLNGQSSDDLYSVQLHCGNPQAVLDYNLIQNAQLLSQGNGSNPNNLIFDYSIDLDPEFVDEENLNFSLSEKSRAIGAGIDVWSDYGLKAPTRDLLGSIRPNPAGTNPDLGAYENSLATSPYPDKVKGLIAEASSKSAKLSWTSSPENNLQKYIVYQSNTSGFKPTTSDSIGESTSTTFLAEDLINGATYYFKVAAVNTSNQIGSVSDQAQVVPKFSGAGGWYVETASSGGLAGGNGSTDIPFLYLKDAVEQASDGDTIFIGAGTHTATTTKWNITFSGEKSLILKGQGPDKTILDAEKKNRHFYFPEQETQLDTSFQILDMTLTNGQVNDGPGGSIHLNGVWTNNGRSRGHSILIKNVHFISNKAIPSSFSGSSSSRTEGGAIAAYRGASIHLRDSKFENNFASFRGGAIIINDEDDQGVAEFSSINTTFYNNQLESVITTGSFGTIVESVSGGAMFLLGLFRIDFESSTFDSNMAKVNGECCNNQGGAVNIDGVNFLTIKNSRFVNNKIYTPDNNQGGNALGGAMNIVNFWNPVQIQNNLFVSNIAEGGFDSNGGGAWGGNGGALRFGQHQNPTDPEKSKIIISNNTFYRNKSLSKSPNATAQHGAIESDDRAALIVFNNIFWKNEAQNNNNFDSMYGDLIHSQNTIVSSNSFDKPEYATALLNKGSNNFSSDPKFVLDGSKDSLAIKDASGMIGKGIIQLDGYRAPAVDILGNSRPTQLYNPDLGAYENSALISLYPDIVKNLQSDAGNKYIHLYWDENLENNISHYAIYMSTESNFEPTVEDSIGQTSTTTYNALDLENGKAYFFKVAAVNSDGNMGDFSDEVDDTPLYTGPVWWVANVQGPPGDGSFEAPFGNLNFALERISSGDTIIFKPGEYSGSNVGVNVINYPGDLDLTIRGESGNPNDVVFDGKDNFAQRFFSFDQSQHHHKIFFEGITFQNSYNDGNGNQGSGGGAFLITAKNEIHFNRVNFKNNTAEQRDFHSGGGAILIGQNEYPVTFVDCYFKNNRVVNFDNNEWTNSLGGAVSITPYWDYLNINTTNPYEFHSVIFEQCTFESNNVHSDNGSDHHIDGAAIYSEANIIVRNSLFLDQRVTGTSNQKTFSSALYANPSYNNNAEISYGGKVLIINNTFDNFDERNGFAVINQNQQQLTKAFVYNNIFSSNISNKTSGYIGSQVDAYIGHNLYQAEEIYLDGPNIFDNSNNLETENIEFKDRSNRNYSLKSNSPAIDAGVFSYSAADVFDELGNSNAPQVDRRNFFRVGIPDIGAYEFGGSRFIINFDDDIAGRKDTTFANLGQNIEFTVSTTDKNGSIINSNETVDWSIFPNEKYVTFVSLDTTTAGGDATAVVQVKDVERGKGFRFRIQAVIAGESQVSSQLYVIEEIVTGAPPAVANLSIDPADWTNKSTFTMSWQNPQWDRDIIGAIVGLNDGEYFNSKFLSYPEGKVLNSYTDSLSASGKFEAFIWLVDELGNEDRANRDSVEIKFDNLPPNPFSVYEPYGGEWVNPEPTFTFENSGDGPSGVKEFRLFINDQVYQSYSTVTKIGDTDAYINITTPLPDGLYRWYMETEDYAGNVTKSNEESFGVDTQPPSITHSNPLTIIDEGVDSPTIDATFIDQASGVESARIFYRVSGSGSAWKSKDILSGSVFISASDINLSGIEYYISAQDSLGSVGIWPSENAYQSVQIRSSSNISTTSRWASGIPGGTDILFYQLFSIPFEVGNGKSAITNVLGESDKFKYRLFKYSGGDEVPWEEDPISLVMGESYFLIYDPVQYEINGVPSKIEFEFGQGISTPTNPPYEKSVSTNGWTMFGSPYNFDLTLSNVYTQDGIPVNEAGSLYGFSNGSWRSVSSVQPWQGYAFKSTSASELVFDARGTGFNKIGKALTANLPANNHNDWKVNIAAISGSYSDDLNAVGVKASALNTHDKFDKFEPPLLPGSVVLYLDNKSREDQPDIYAKDFRSPNEEGHYWDIKVLTPPNDKSTYITFDGLGYIPDEFDAFLINKDTKDAQDLSNETIYRLPSSGKDDYTEYDMRLIIGSKEFADKNNAGVQLYPDAFTLSQNYPNPFNPQTSIKISLQEDARVDLIIYNLLGEEITRLSSNELKSAGYYNFIWKGTNTSGNKVSTGVYLYHAMVKDRNGKMVLNKTKKMVFLK